MNEQINPSAELIDKAKSAMKKRTKPFYTHPRKIYRASTIVACFMVLLIAVVTLPTLNYQFNSDEKLPGSGKSEDSIENDLLLGTWYSVGVENDPMKEVVKTDSASDQQNNQIAENDKNYTTDSKVDSGDSKRLSETQIYTVEKFGQIVPKNILSGYNFEEASIYSSNETGDKLRVVYTNSLNYIDINVHNFESQDDKRLVSANDEEKYNITQYSIPFADSIPSDLYETMHYPIFMADEITAESLLLRKYKTNEQGEGNSKYHMNFGILCGDIVVEYTIKGNSLNNVFDMITSSHYYTK